MKNVETDYLRENYGDIICGREEPTKPEIPNFVYFKEALEMVSKHIDKKSKTLVDADVDMDGVGAAYIVHKGYRKRGIKSQVIINKERKHGITENAVKAINKMKIGLLVIVDSGSNDISLIKQLHCDVLILDHHNISVKDTFGETMEGMYYVINPQVSEVNSSLRNAANLFSGARVAYEFFRGLERYRGEQVSIMEDNRLYQWVAITLWSDMIELEEQNQWYIYHTIERFELEENLSMLVYSLTKKYVVDKSFILFKLSPAVNIAMRCDRCAQICDIVINRPEDILEETRRNRKAFERAMDSVNGDNLDDKIFNGLYKVHSDIGRGFCGLIANKLAQKYERNIVAYKEEGDELIGGSFRAFNRKYEFLEEFKKAQLFAEGHNEAFGVGGKINVVEEVMGRCDNKGSIHGGNNIVFNGSKARIGTIGVIEDIKEFKRSGMMMELAIINSRVSSKSQIMLISKTDKNKCKLVEERGRVFIYEIAGIGKAIAFEKVVNKEEINIYVEGACDIKFYIK